MNLTTGELAKIMGITKETLFHYDEIGLFRPAIVLPNRYRYYEITHGAVKYYSPSLCVCLLLLANLGFRA